MGKRTSFEPGTFSWVDLGTTDPEAAKSFYGGLFGWEADDMPVTGGGVYSMVKVSGEYVAAIAEQQPQQREAGIPPFWNSYVTVKSADETAEAVSRAGGNVHAPPFDVMSSGRMAVLADPTGAVLSVWEPRDHIGATLVNEPGCLTWNELATDDVPAALRFYSEVFGWVIEEIDTDGGPRYWTIGHQGGASGQNGGIRELGPAEEGVPPNWVPYFAVEAVDGALAKAEELGGQGLMPPMEVPAGKFAGVRDPQGAVFSIFEGDFDD